MIPEYTDEELMLFAEALANRTVSEEDYLLTIKNFSTQGYGILHTVLNIPFDELPLSIGDKEEFFGWYKACVYIRLKIGR